MEQTAEFLGASGQAAELDAAHRGRVVSQDRYVDLHLRTVPALVAHPSGPPVQQTGNDTFDYRATVPSGAGQLHLTGSPFAGQPRRGERLLDRLGRGRGGERLDGVRDAHRENAAGVEGLAQMSVVEGVVTWGNAACTLLTNGTT
jgi:hypothetical protein